MADFHQSFDGSVWAKEFVTLAKLKGPEFATEEATMTGWFANAIMRGYDEHARRHPGADELVDEPCEQCGTPTARVSPRLCDQHVNR